MTPQAQTYLHPFSVKPGHLEAWRALWPTVVALRLRHHARGAILFN